MKTKTKSRRAIALLVCYFCYAEGAYFSPNAYTLPDGLQSVSGSSSTGGCQPESCVMMPISDTAINGCDCPGSTPASGVLIDGVIPSIDTTQRGTWASELFVVNRDGEDSIMIGFQFSLGFSLRGIEVVLYHCPVQGIGITGVKVYSSFLFPAFNNFASTLLVTHNSPPNDNCQSLSTISMPVQPMGSSDLYFVEFLFTSGSSVHQPNWLYLGEMRFSDETPSTMAPTTMIETTTETGEMATTTVSDQHPTSTATTGHSSTTSSFSTELSMPTTTTNNENVSITDNMNNDTTQPNVDTTQPTVVTTSSYINVSDISPITSSFLTQSNIPTDDIAAQPSVAIVHVSSYINVPDNSSITTPIQVVTTSKSEAITQEGSNPTTITVVALAGIIGLLILLMIGGCALCLCFVCYRKHKSSLLNQYALPTELTLHEKRGSLPTSANSCYTHGKCSSRITYGLPDPSSVYCNPEIYSELDGDSGLYDDIGENHYAVIPETIIANKTNNDSGKSIDVSLTVTNQVKKYAPIESERLRQPIDKTTNETVPGAIGIYSQVGENIQEVQESEYYTDMQGSRAASQLSICSRRSSCNSGPLIQLSRPLCHTMEDNPTYNSAWSLLEDDEKQEPEEDTYADPDARFNRSQLTIYETVYSDSLIKPSIFKQNDTATPNNSGMVKQDSTKESDEKEEEKNLASLMYSPIYLSYDALSPATHQKQPIVVTNDNIRGIKVLGTGFFGKVVLADTVGLSLKDLGLSETDDDKSASIRVAVKKLKLNASKSTRDAFEKECRFMSRLDHPNVICMLGVCTTDPSQFIIMEYMEKGDLNGYLEAYESIIHSPKSPKEEEIHVSTLVHMCTQIAAAMKYLVSRNFIHRDLAARNCLVGDKDVIKLADFGMSRNLYESHYYMVQGNAVMPVRWMASECFYGKFSAKTDVWAFGVTMWEIFMLAKERPYSDMEDMEVVNDAIEKEERTLLQQPDHCPDDVFEVMMRCWAKNPKDRATFDELHALLIQLN